LTILTYYASINRGVSKKVLSHYPNITPFEKPVINLPDNLDPNWVSGFVFFFFFGYKISNKNYL